MCRAACRFGDLAGNLFQPISGGRDGTLGFLLSSPGGLVSLADLALNVLRCTVRCILSGALGQLHRKLGQIGGSASGVGRLFCGFLRNPGEPPVAYPVACLPQAWAAGSVFMMLQACLGLSVAADQVTIVDPRLPIGIDRLWIDRLQVGEHVVSLAFERLHDRIMVEFKAPEGLVKVLGPLASGR